MVTKQWNGLPHWDDPVLGKVGEGGDACVPEQCQGAPKMVQYGRVVSHVDGTIRWASGEAGIVFESKLIEELSRWWPDILEVPCLVKGGMVAGFCVAAGVVKVANVLVSRGVPKEQSSKVMFVEFGALISCLLHADMRTKEFEVLEVWFDTPPTLERGDTGTGVDTTIVEVGCMEQRS